MPVKGLTVRNARRRLGLTQGQLATYADVDRSYVSQIENGHVENIGCSVLVRLAKQLEVSTDYLLGLTTDPQFRRTAVGHELTERERTLLRKFIDLPEEAQEMILAGLDAIHKIKVLDRME